MKRIANYLLTATALLGAAALLTFAAKNDFGLARNMETLVNMMRELSVYYVDEVDADRLMTDAAEVPLPENPRWLPCRCRCRSVRQV